MKLLAILMAFILSSQAFGANPGSCGGVFLSKNAAQVELQEILKENYDINPSSLFQRMILKYSARRLAKTSSSTPRELRETVVQVDRLVQIAESLGRNSETGTYLEKEWVRREVLSRSVEDIMHAYGHDRGRTRGVLKKIFSHRAVRFLMNPAELPFVADKQIPSHILEKMISEGPESVRSELRDFYQSQKQYQIDAYRYASRMYKWVAIVVFAAMSWDHFQDAKQDMNEKKKEKLNESLDDLEEILNVLDSEFERRGLYEKIIKKENRK